VTSGDLALVPLLEQRPRPTAILAATDTLALGLLHAAWENGVTVPSDVSIVGFDDTPMAAASVPSLTTVRMPIAEIIASGVEFCVGDEVWSGDGVAPRKVLQPSLVVRRSTAAAAST
jgi:DNA-binding LacI/PurR family transcriptional regulator